MADLKTPSAAARAAGPTAGPGAEPCAAKSIALRRARELALVPALALLLLLGVVQNLLTLAQVPSFWIRAIYCGIILVALMIARVTTGRAQD